MISPRLTKAVESVLQERTRQVTVKQFHAKHDDEHDSGILAAAGSAYALYAADKLHPQSQGDADYGAQPPLSWPFHVTWWRPNNPRRALVKAAALIIAEIERIDRGN